MDGRRDPLGQMLAGRGFVTFYPNYRGSIGRGVDFSKADHRDLMGKEFEDMIAGIDHLVREGLVDGEKVGIGGGSYGGYASAWAATYGSERFKAAVAWMGISDWYQHDRNVGHILGELNGPLECDHVRQLRSLPGEVANQAHQEGEHTYADSSRGSRSASTDRPIPGTIHCVEVERSSG